MKTFWTGAAASALIALGTLPGVAAAQAGARDTGTGFTAPWTRDFWGYAGATIGRSDLDAGCPALADCDDRDRAWRVYGGGRFNRIIGGEVGYVNLGDFTRAGGQLESQALDLALVAGVPFLQNSNVFGKLGTVYSQTDVSAAPGFGVQTGDADGWGLRYGVGVQLEVNQNWALRADWDRFRIDVPGGDEDIDTLMFGAQYTFR